MTPSGRLTATPDPALIIDARPEKEFFISMLIKDIELIPAIVDLVDNSVDGARASKENASLDGFSVALTIDPTRFVIDDNCGGLDAEIAQKYAFRFGRPGSFKGTEGSVGQFGVGMKRALFKIGNHFTVASKAELSQFKMTVPVKDWAAQPDTDWTFQFDSVDFNQGVPKEERGVLIEVSELHDIVAQDFATVDFLGKLKTHLRLRHQDALSLGLHVSVNNDTIQSREHLLLTSADVQPIRQDIVLTPGPGEASVQATIYAGVVQTSETDKGKDDAEAEDFTEPADAGWYLYCNGRLLLAADRTELTGWGASAAVYHPQYRQFRGYAYLWAKDASLLPWNTTKTGVDRDSPVFRAVQQEMFKALASVQAILNRMKKEKQHYPESERPLSAAIAAASPTKLNEVAISDQFVSPPTPPKPSKSSKVQRIQYDADRAEFEAVKDVLGAATIGEVGRETFRYFYENEVGG